jgi:drug/metabolite transporter (DMT)-like permease
MFGTNSHAKSVLLALFVTFLWSTSWVFIKIGLEDIPALTFAGMRYVLAFLFLLPMAFRKANRAALRELTSRDWILLFVLGAIFYCGAQGAQFLGLSYLPAITTNLLLSFTTIVVALLAIFFLAEKPGILQWIGMAIYLVGVTVFFYGASLPRDEVLGLVIVLMGVLATAIGALLGRYLNRDARLPAIVITSVSMGIGSVILLGVGAAVQGIPQMSVQSWAIILWLALVNTAFAFTLWNHTLRALSAMESSIINSAMMIQIPILALLFLGEDISPKEGIGMLLAGLGILMAQIRSLDTFRQLAQNQADEPQD